MIKINLTTEIKFIHITDTHLLDHPNDTFHGLNTRDNLEKTLSDCHEKQPDMDFILFTGDISQTGSDESYTLFQSIIEQYNTPVYCVPGNHDIPERLQKIIPDSPLQDINIVSIGYFSLFLINSWVKDSHHGRVNDKCLQQLQQHLSKSNSQFHLFAIHHPPVIINSKWLDELGLQNQDQLIKLITNSQQDSLMLCGHVHQEIDKQINTLRLLGTPSTCHQFKANSDTMYRLNSPTPAYRVVQIKNAKNIETSVHYLDKSYSIKVVY